MEAARLSEVLNIASKTRKNSSGGQSQRYARTQLQGLVAGAAVTGAITDLVMGPRCQYALLWLLGNALGNLHWRPVLGVRQEHMGVQLEGSLQLNPAVQAN